MKSLSIALIVITLIVCACAFGIPEYDRMKERELVARELAIKERNVHVNIIFSHSEAAPRGMRIAPEKEAALVP